LLRVLMSTRCEPATDKGNEAAEKAPSANNRRKMFGKVKATLNASLALLAPRIREPIMSRAKPSTRLTIVSPPIVPIAFVRFICCPGPSRMTAARPAR
jgi:hypothetical protein